MIPIQCDARQAAHISKPLTLLSPTIFHEPWWMRLSCGGTEREAVVESGGKLVGRLPYRVGKGRFGLTVLGMPATAHVLGPAVAPEFSGSNFPRSLKQLSIVGDLIAQLDPASHVSFRLHGEMTNTLAFDMAGFSSSVGYTVEVEPAPRDVLWRQMRDKTRNVIRRAQEQLTVAELDEPAPFLDFYEDNLRERGVRNHYDYAMCTGLIAECIDRGVGRMLIARAASGAPHAAIFTVWDQHREHYFMSTRTRGSLNGATSLLIWAAIQHAALNELVFDMDGVHVRQPHIPNILLLTGFGGSLKPRYVVRRTSAAREIARDAAKSLVRRLRGAARTPAATGASPR